MISFFKNKDYLHYWVFQGLFINGTLFHHTEEWTSRPLAIFSILSLLLFVLIPKLSQWVFLIVLIVCSTSNLIKFPNLANHSNITLFIALFLTPYQILLIARPKKVPFPQINRALKCIILSLYFFAVFHKLNWDFLNPEVSCANNKLQDYFILIPDSYEYLKIFLKNIMPYLGLLLEGTIPLLLFFSKTRPLGVLNLVLIHFILAPMGFTDFSSLAMALAWCFLDKEKIKVDTIRRDFSFLTYSILILVVILGLTRFEEQIETYEFIEGALFSLLFTPFLFIHLKNKIDVTKIQFPKKIFPSLFVIFFFIFGFNNYLGLRTAGTFSMFSNLKTEEKKSNHILLYSNPFKIFGLQDDAIEVLAVDAKVSGFYRKMPQVDQKIPRIEFSRILDLFRDYHYKNVEMKVRYQGKIRSTMNAGFDPLFDLDVPSWQKKLFKFRHIQNNSNPQECLW